MTGASSPGPLSGGAPDMNNTANAAAVDIYARPEVTAATDNSGRRLAIEPPAWDLMPPVETETVRRFRPS